MLGDGVRGRGVWLGDRAAEAGEPTATADQALRVTLVTVCRELPNGRYQELFVTPEAVDAVRRGHGLPSAVGRLDRLRLEVTRRRS